MILRDMLAAAVRPWVRAKHDEASVGIEVGRSEFMIPRWSIEFYDANATVLRGEKRVYILRGGKPLIGDLWVAFHSSARVERDMAKRRAAEQAVNDSKAAA